MSTPLLPKREIRVPEGAVGGMIDFFVFCVGCLVEDEEVPDSWLHSATAEGLECFCCQKPLSDGR